MIYVGCSGFPVPASRYWGEFSGVELTETELAIPGEGTIRRWLRESPKAFAFSMLAPKQVVESTFAVTDENLALTASIGEVAKKMKARAVVLAIGPEFRPTPTHRKVIRSFVHALPKSFPTRIVLDLPAWKPAQVEAAAEHPLVISAYDPLHDDAPEGDVLYARCPGPAGRRSRYDDKSIAEIAERFRDTDAEEIICVFRNQDMFVNARSIQQVLRAEEQKAAKAKAKASKPAARKAADARARATR